MTRAISTARTLLVTAAGMLALAVPAQAQAGGEENILEAASYPDMTTYSCRTEALEIHPGQNLNLFGATKTCPNAQVVSGPGDTSVFAPGSNARGFITRFKPSMVEIKGNGELETPSVWDLHLHHVVWLAPNAGPTFASGEEKTEVKLPQGYGINVRGDANWGLNYMLHNLTAEGGRQVYVTWEVDWVPETSPARSDINEATIQWMDVAGAPQVYPVFDAEKGFDRNGDGEFVFPDEVPTTPGEPGYEEAGKISQSGTWVVPGGGRTLVFGAGHLHPGGLSVDLEVARDGADAGNIDGDDPAEVRPLFSSGARYYEPAGAVSWDVSMEATRPNWRIALKAGDTVSIDTTYDVEEASWYESMGILPLAVTRISDPAARDPFDQEAEVREMYEKGGILTHGRLPENIDAEANKNLGLPDPRKLDSKGRVPKSGIDIDGFRYGIGGYSAFRGFPSSLARPPLVGRKNDGVSFTNFDALSGMPDEEQAWHSVTSCKAPCNRGSGIGYPLANGPVKFDSGQLGFGTGANAGVTTGSNEYTTPRLPKAGKTYTYFCRIHPFMRGSVRVKEKNKR
jgi:hypothetical protein